MLFNDTMYYNIAYGNLKADRDMVETAARYRPTPRKWHAIGEPALPAQPPLADPRGQCRGSVAELNVS